MKENFIYMRRFFLLWEQVLVLAGCDPIQKQQQTELTAFVEQFKAAYPDSWQAKLPHRTR